MVEKNDVDITQLFSWGKHFELKDAFDNVVSNVYIRLIGDADINRSKVLALRESAELRRKLRDKDSDERLAYILDKDLLDREQLLSLNIMLSNREIAQKAYREVSIPYPIEPKSDAKLEEFEKFQKEVDEYPAKKQAAISKFIENEITALLAKLKKQTDEDLYKSYEASAINELCEERMLRTFRESSTYFACYKDEAYKERYFGSLEDFRNLDTDIKNQFIEAYQSLEIPAEELKKLQVVTR